jgi:hypothetical protein
MLYHPTRRRFRLVIGRGGVARDEIPRTARVTVRGGTPGRSPVGLVVAWLDAGKILTKFRNTGLDGLELAASSDFGISSMRVLLLEMLDLQSKAAMLVS